MFAYEDGFFSACGEVECCALDSGIVPFAVTGKDACGCGDEHADEGCGGGGDRGCGGDCSDEDCDCGMQGEIGDSCGCT